MNADFTRDTFNPNAQRRSVRFQQGRIPLDAELNEAQDLLHTRGETADADIIGHAGGPEDNAGFEIQLHPADGLIATAGRYYVDGILSTLHADTPLTDQPDFPDYTLPVQPGIYLAYLDVSFDHITARVDPSLEEVALNGADTTSRQRTKAQVKLLLATNDPDAKISCSDELEPWEALTTPPTGTIAARAQPQEIAANECSMTPGAGYRSLLNQLYRIEIHDAGDEENATWKWSRENASIVANWYAKNGDELTIEPQGRDPHRAFVPGGWVELIDRERELQEAPGTLVQLINVRDDILTIDPATATGTVDINDFKTAPRIRRWESAGALPLNDNPDADGFSPLEYGLQATFGEGTYRTGDYWLIPARTATGGIEWPTDDATGDPLFEPRKGIVHHFARLALLSFDGNEWTVQSDCRKLFPPLTKLKECDLKLHNKHLHGKGVVCGLQVYCGGDDAVRIQPGHAIACDGTDLLLPKETRFPVVQRARAAKLLDDNGNGDALLVLQGNENDEPVFSLRPAPASPDGMAGIFSQLLKGTIWEDFYDDCLEPLIDFLKAQFLDDDGSIMPDSMRRRITLANLIAHRRNTAPTSRLWLSQTQHDILKDSYEGLLKFVGNNKTFCGIDDNFPAFPDYPFADRNLRVAFSKASLSGVRLAPSGTIAYAWSDKELGRIYVFDTKTDRLVEEIEVESATNLPVQDVAFIRVGNSNRAVVFAGSSSLSVINQYTLSNHNKTGSTLTLTGGSLVTALAHPQTPGVILAVQPSVGVHFLKLSELNSGPLPNPDWRIPAAGHLAIDGSRIAATGREQPNLAANQYDSLYIGQLDSANGPQLSRKGMSLNRIRDDLSTGSDGIAISGTANKPTIHVVVDPSAQQRHKSVLVLGADELNFLNLRALPVADDGGNQTGPVAIEAIAGSNRVLFGITRRNQLYWSSGSPSGQSITATVPAQEGPVAISATGGQFVVAHDRAFTLTLAENQFLQAPSIEDKNLDTYRDELLAVFEPLALSLLQTLKDCLCDKLMVRCPECEEDDYIPLAHITIQANASYHICNRARQELVTFPKFFYWLSALPLVPLVNMLVDKFCCWIIAPAEADEQDADERERGFRKKTKGGNWSRQISTLGLMAATKVGGFSKLNRSAHTEFTRLKTWGQFALERLATDAPAKRKEPKPVIPTEEIVGQQTESVTATLATEGIRVHRVAAYEDLLEAESVDVLDVRALPRTLREGDTVELFTRDNKVAFYRLKKAKAATPASEVVSHPTSDAPSPQASLELLQQFREAQKQIADMREEQTKARLEREAEIVKLASQVARTEELRVKAEAQHKAEVVALKETATRQIAELQKQTEIDRKSWEQLRAEQLRERKAFEKQLTLFQQRTEADKQMIEKMAAENKKFGAITKKLQTDMNKIIRRG